MLDDRIGVRIKGTERKIFEFLPHLLHAHAAGERRIDVERLLGDPLARRRWHELQCAHVVQAIGKLDQEDADVVGDREQELAQILGLLGFARNQFQPLQLGEAFHQRADLVSENLVDFRPRRLGILDGIVQQGGNDGGVVELEVGQDRGNLERMREIGVARRTGLRAVCLHGVDIGAVEEILVGIWVIGPDAFDQIVLPHHARTRPGCLDRRRRGRRRRQRGLLRRGLHLGWALAPIRHGRITAFAVSLAWAQSLRVQSNANPAAVRSNPRWPHCLNMIFFGKAGIRPSGRRPRACFSGSGLMRPRSREASGNHKSIGKSKGPEIRPGLCSMQRVRNIRSPRLVNLI